MSRDISHKKTHRIIKSVESTSKRATVKVRVRVRVTSSH